MNFLPQEKIKRTRPIEVIKNYSAARAKRIAQDFAALWVI
jgi:hypothetical protein